MPGQIAGTQGSVYIPGTPYQAVADIRQWDLTVVRDNYDSSVFGDVWREYVIGLGEALYFDGAYGAAADTFESILRAPDSIATENHDRVLDWGADALDRDTRPRPDIDRQAVYRSIRARMDDEIAVRPGNSVASYWRAAAARAQGDLQSAWDAAQSAWVRAPLASDGGSKLREDLDRLVTTAIIPERAKLLGQPPQRLILDWEQFKERWKR